MTINSNNNTNNKDLSNKKDLSNNIMLKNLENKMKNTNARIWFNDPSVLINQDKLLEIWPCQNMTREEKINAITRLIIYLTFFGYIITYNQKVLMSGFVTLIILMF